MMQESVKCEGPRQHNGESLVGVCTLRGSPDSTGWNQEEQLYLENHAIYKHLTFSTVLLRPCTFH